MENNENKAKKQRIIIAALILGMMFCIGITIWAVFFRKPETKSLVPDYAPQQSSMLNLWRTTAEVLMCLRVAEEFLLNTKIQ